MPGPCTNFHAANNQNLADDTAYLDFNDGISPYEWNPNDASTESTRNTKAVFASSKPLLDQLEEEKEVLQTLLIEKKLTLGKIFEICERAGAYSDLFPEQRNTKPCKVLELLAMLSRGLGELKERLVVTGASKNQHNQKIENAFKSVIRLGTFYPRLVDTIIKQLIQKIDVCSEQQKAELQNTIDKVLGEYFRLQRTPNTMNQTALYPMETCKLSQQNTRAQFQSRFRSSFKQ